MNDNHELQIAPVHELTVQTQVAQLPSMPEEKTLIQVKKDGEEVKTQSKGVIRMLAPGTELKVHPAAEEYPSHSGDEYTVLVNSIRESGLLEPIKLVRGRIIDGRHRYRACLRLDIPILVEELNLTEEEVSKHVLASNQRRSLSPGQWAILALKKLPEYEARANERKLSCLAQNTVAELIPQRKESGRVIELLAKAYPVNPKYILYAKRIQESKPELLEKVFSGEMGIIDAHKEVKILTVPVEKKVYLSIEQAFQIALDKLPEEDNDFLHELAEQTNGKTKKILLNRTRRESLEILNDKINKIIVGVK